MIGKGAGISGDGGARAVLSRAAAVTQVATEHLDDPGGY